MDFSKIFSTISTVSTSVLFYSISKFVVDNEIINYSASGFGLLTGAFIAFKVIPDAVRLRDVSTVLVVSSVMASTYTLNSKSLQEVIVKNECTKIEPNFKKIEENYKRGAKSLDLKKFTDNNNSLQNNLFEINQDIKEEMEKYKKDVGKTVAREKKKRKTYYRWWTNEVTRLGGDTKKISTSTDLIDFLASTKVSGSLLSKRDNILNMISLNDREYISAYNANMRGKANIEHDKKRYFEIKKLAQSKAPSIYSLAIMLLILGFFIEGFAVAFDLFIMIREEKIEIRDIKRKSKLVEEKNRVLNDINEMKSLAYNPAVLKYLYEFATRANKPLKIYDYGVWKNGGGGRKGRVKAKTNVIVGLILVQMLSGKDWDMITTSDILKVNKSATETPIGTIPPLGSTNTRPYKNAINYMRGKERVEDMSLDEVEKLIREFVA